MGTLVLHLADLASELGYSLQTVKRLVSDDPGRLPPGISLAAPGAKKGKTVFLRSTFELWLQQKERKATPTPEPDAGVPPTDQPGRGRPRKARTVITRLQEEVA